MADGLDLDRKLSELTELLFVEWDPIGINNDESAPRDEYGRYAPRVLTALREGASPGQL